MLYTRIKNLCEERKLSIRRLENECDLSTGSIAKWKKAQPSAMALYRVAKRLGVSVEDLLEGL